MIIELEVNGARVIISGENLSVSVTEEAEARSVPAFLPRTSVDFPTGEQIKSLRKRLGLSQIRFGDLLGFSQVTVCRWERGYDKPSGPAALQIAQMMKAEGI